MEVRVPLPQEGKPGIQDGPDRHAQASGHDSAPPARGVHRCGLEELDPDLGPLRTLLPPTAEERSGAAAGRPTRGGGVPGRGGCHLRRAKSR